MAYIFYTFILLGFYFFQRLLQAESPKYLSQLPEQEVLEVVYLFYEAHLTASTLKKHFIIHMKYLHYLSHTRNSLEHINDNKCSETSPVHCLLPLLVLT